MSGDVWSCDCLAWTGRREFIFRPSAFSAREHASHLMMVLEHRKRNALDD
jgi:hypothetical protein